MIEVKTKKEMESARNNVSEYDESQYPGMSYEQGIADALDWALGEVDDDEFEYVGS